MSEIRIKTLVVGMVGTNCYLVYDHETKRAAVIDPGDGAGQIANMAVSLGLKPEAILLTHGHFDHIMAAKELKETWNVPIYACEKEIDVLTDGQKSLVAGYFREPYTITPDVTVKEGSCCYYIEKESVLFSGDTLFAGSYGRTDFPTGSGRQIAESVRRLLSTLPDDTMVYPGHMDTTTIGFEKKYNPLSGAME